jgi:RNA polymerase sigma-70 factor (ECF subfamily)
MRLEEPTSVSEVERVATFEGHRGLLRSLAYRMPSSAGQGARAEAFFTALHAADVPALMAVLTEDAQAWSDGGGKVTAARRVIRGAARVARFLAGIVRKAPPGLHLAPATVNGRPGRLLLRAEMVVAALSIEADAAGRVSHVFIVRNPDKLSATRPAGECMPAIAPA